ncbi:MAG: hypothetical protein V2J62_10495 [candidate division KSB1 bacterium]|nr:hypothetical protein [candidate division KSB1 bacterium]
MEIRLEELIRLVTAEVVKELKKQGVTVIGEVGEQESGAQNASLRTKSETPDMSKYVTPVLTEKHITRLHELTGELIIPKNTIITPRARELVKEKRLSIRFTDAS